MARSPLITIDPDGNLILDVGEEILAQRRKDAVPIPSERASE